MRFVHAADLHLDSPLRSIALRDPDLGARLRLASREVLKRIVDTAIDRQADALVLAGDVFDAGEPDLAARACLVVELARLARAGIPTVVIRGNHDALMDLDRHGPLGQDVHLLTAARPTVTLGETDFHGLSFEAPHVRHSTLPQYPDPTPGRRNVGLMHTSLDGAAGHDPYAPCATADLLAHGYDYWALGHIHQRFARAADGGHIVMPGIPQGRHIREAGVGSVTLVTMSDSVQTEAIPVAQLAFDSLEIDLSDLHDAVSRTQAVTDALQTAALDGIDVALRITLAGDGGAAWADDPRGHLAPIADGIEGVHLESVRLRAITPAEANPLADSLIRLMREEAAKPGFQDRTAETMATLRAALPPDLRGELDGMLAGDGLAELLEDGMAAVMARLDAP